MVRHTETKIKRPPEKPMSKELHAAIKEKSNDGTSSAASDGEVLEEPLWFTDEMVEAQLEALGDAPVKPSLRHI